MKLKVIATCALLSAICLSASAQGTAFTYQGHLLNNGTNAANGLYDFQFALSSAPSIQSNENSVRLPQFLYGVNTP